MHISRVVVKNYRGLQLADVQLKPGLNVLVGANGSGKSSFLNSLRLAIDGDLGNRSRQLTQDDFYRGIGPATPTQILVTVDFADLSDSIDDRRARLEWGGASGTARVTYRFRPNGSLRPKIDDKTASLLTIDDYDFERTAGMGFDPRTAEWDTDPLGGKLDDHRFTRFQVVEVPALRDVVEHLRRQRMSPLARLLKDISVDEPTKRDLEVKLAEVHRRLEDTKVFQDLARDIEERYRHLAGDINDLRVTLGLSEPNFSALQRELGLYVSDDQLDDFDLSRNGLGYNNLLYIAMLMEIFRRRTLKGESNQLLLIEEPEAHLHPQAQEALIRSLAAEPFQSIVTTHSTHVVVAAGLNSVITFDRASIAKGQTIVDTAQMTAEEVNDLQRYLDATRGALLFAKKLIFVEGLAEQIAIPLYAESMGISLAKEGVQIVAVGGRNFAPFIAFAGANGLDRPFVAITDGDNHRKDGRYVEEYDDGKSISETDRIFTTNTTFEYAIVNLSSLGALRTTAREFHLPELESLLSDPTDTYTPERLKSIQLKVLRAATGVGKGRFAQVFGQLIELLSLLPPTYIFDAIESLISGRNAQRPSTSSGTRY